MTRVYDPAHTNGDMEGQDYFIRTGPTHPMWGHDHQECHSCKSSGIILPFKSIPKSQWSTLDRR